MESEAGRYLDDPAFRVEMLRASLTNPENIYSRTRLASYGLVTRGWDMLPAWTPTASPIDTAAVDALVAGGPVQVDPTVSPLWDGVRPKRMADWVALGRRVFYEYPLRPEVFAEHALRNPQVAQAVGLRAAPDGMWPGVVAFEDVDGTTQVGITCALCHVAVQDGVVVEGMARRDLDYGRMRLAFHRDTDWPLPEGLAKRMASWGPGRADITQDDDEDPVAIVDLWGVREHAYLTQAGTVRQVHPAALAIRQETQLLHANRERTRPPRALAWALAMFVYSLQPPDSVAAAGDVDHGRSLFGRHCARCHADANHAGPPIDATTVGTDLTLAQGRARGTGRYRVAPLVRVAEAAPYLHHGVVPTLTAMLDPARLTPEYTEGTRGPGAVPGHEYGTGLPLADRTALVAFLTTL